MNAKSEENMVHKMRQMKRWKDGKTKKGILKQNDLARQLGVNGRCGNLGLDGASDRNCWCENGKENNIAESSISQPKTKERQHKEMSLQEMYDGQSILDDDDDDDDSDWEPVEKHVEVTRWFCTNCTMVNFDDIVHCDICGEHRESGILEHGFFASPLLPDAFCTDCESEIKETHRVNSSQNPAPSTAIGYDERMLLHSEVEMKSHPHPERPDRVRAIAASLATAGIFPGRCFPIAAREITREELQMVHTLEHVEDVDLTSRIFVSYFTPDTYANEHSACAARLAAGLCADLASAIVSGRVKNGFALVRPPGHHAGVRQAMGFCLHNNAAVAVLAAQAAGAKKVLIVDWDVHHGNGTQEIFEQNKSVLYVSLHRHEGGKFYPGTGAADEVGSMGAEGYCVNVPWSRKGVGDNDYVFAFQQVVLPIASEFAPDLTIISAGFDAARGDPLGCCDVTPIGYAMMTEMLNDVSGGKLLVILEGGYNLRSISSSATTVIKVLLGESPDCELENALPSKSGLKTVLDVLGIQMNYWPNLRPVFARLQSQLGTYTLRSKKRKMRMQQRRILLPHCWRWGKKRFKLAVPSRGGKGVTESYFRHSDDQMEESPTGQAVEQTGDLLPRKRKKVAVGGEGSGTRREERRIKRAAGRRGDAAEGGAERVEAFSEAAGEASAAVGEAEPSSSFFEGMIDLEDVPSPSAAPESSPFPPAMGSHSYPASMTESLEGMRVNDPQFLQPDLPDAAVGFMMQAPPRFSFPFQASFRFCHEEKFKAQAEMSLKERMFDQIRLQVESLQSALLSYREVCNMPGKFEELEVRLATAMSERDDHARARVAACAEARAADDRARSVAAEKDSKIADLISRVEDITSIQAELFNENLKMKAELLDEKAMHAGEKASLIDEIAKMKEEISCLGESQKIDEAAKTQIIEDYFSSEAAEKRELELMESAAEQIYDAIREMHPDWDISFLTEPSSDEDASDPK